MTGTRHGPWHARRRRAALLVALALALTGCAATGDHSGTGITREAPTAALALPVGHAGRWLTDARGRVLLLHGVNEVVKTAPWDPAAEGFSDADAAWLADNGLELVRLGVMASEALPAPGRIDTTYLDQLVAVARDLGRHGVLTLFDLHQDGWGPAFAGMDGFPAWMTLTGNAPNRPTPYPNEYDNPAVRQAFTNFWQDAPGPGGTGLQEDDAALLTALAGRAASVPTVLGYDVLNEPWPGNDPSACGSGDGCTAVQAAELEPFDARADVAIRRADPEHLVLVEPFVQFDGGGVPASFTLPDNDTRSGISVHPYDAHPTGSTGSITEALGWSHRTGGAAIATEWGASSDTTALEATADALDSAMIPWAYWAYDDCCGPTPGSDSLLLSRTGPPNGANARTAVVDAVVRPHPLAVAGTPTAVHYDPTTKRLLVAWRATAVSGGRFSDNALTTIEVPVAVYGHGYTVVSTGAVVTSAPCAPLLTVHLARGRSSASVQVEPASGCGRATPRSGAGAHARAPA